MSKIVETNFGTLVDSKRVARGSASNVTKKGAFYVFSIRVENDDIRDIHLLTELELSKWEKFL